MPIPHSSDPRWRAVTRRDAHADGQFVYAVKTTGVFCRPSCAARTPNPENVVFFDTPAAATAAGFRACKRCRPAHALGSPAEEVVARVQARLDAAGEALPLDLLAREVGWSRSHLQKTFTRLVGVSPRQYAQALSVERAKAHLRRGETVLEATYAAGLGAAGALYETDALGMTPGTYRRGGEGERITYGTFETPLGVVLVACTARGLCAVTLGDEAGALEGALHAEFGRATLVADVGAAAPFAAPIVRYLGGEVGGDALRTLPLDLGGTAFQRQVWAVLRTIPAGETRSYAAVAEALGRPTATRAVAQACGANRAALVVPCHRVVGSDGHLRGYRWGAARKRALLDLEAARAGN